MFYLIKLKNLTIFKDIAMAYAYIKIYKNEKLIRTFGGNLSEVRKMEEYYRNLGKDYRTDFHKREKGK